MASFWKRIGDILSANINDWISGMEDPEKMLPLRIDEMKTELGNAVDAAAEAMAVMKQTEMRHNDIQADIKKYNLAAQQASSSGKDDLAKHCIARVVTLERQEGVAAEALARQEELSAKLKDVIKALKAKIDEADIKMDELIARHKAAKAEEKVVQIMGNIKIGDLTTSFDDLEQKVIKKEQKVAALAELGSTADSLDDEIAEVSDQDEVERRLKKLKGK